MEAHTYEDERIDSYTEAHYTQGHTQTQTDTLEHIYGHTPHAYKWRQTQGKAKSMAETGHRI